MVTVCVYFIGVSLGSLLGGVLYDKVLGATTFRIYGLVSLGLFFAHVLVQCAVRRKTQYDVQTKGKN
jgi:predicted MFS family arabinose efflux permease